MAIASEEKVNTLDITFSNEDNEEMLMKENILLLEAEVEANVSRC